MRRRSRWVGPVVLLALFGAGPGSWAEEEGKEPVGPAPTTSESAPEPVSAPVELGRVDWERDFDAATARAKASGRSILLLFQEVPG